MNLQLKFCQYLGLSIELRGVYFLDEARDLRQGISSESKHLGYHPLRRKGSYRIIKITICLSWILESSYA